MPPARRRNATSADPEAAREAFRLYLDRAAGRVDGALRRLLPGANVRPGLIHESMRYTALSDGKRLRPALVLLAYETAGGTGRKADPLAAALEMVHAFSLIHDDLPCMDDDAFRRGKPSNHVVFGEGVAVLAGDALLAEAMRVIAAQAPKERLGPAIAAAVLGELAEATGSRGVIGGQVLDLTCEGSSVPLETVEFIHRRKTGRLFVAALRMGARAGRARPELLKRLTTFGEATGLAFQIVDDILSAAGTSRELGRDPGRDEAKGKATWPRIAGLAASHGAVDRLVARARRIAVALPRRNAEFLGFCETVDRRRRDDAGRPLGPREDP